MTSRLVYVILAALVLSLTSCNKFKEIEVESVKVMNVTPKGLTGVDASIELGIDNPAPRITLSNIEGKLKYNGKVIGTVTIDPFTIKGRETAKYNIKAKVRLGSDFGLVDAFHLIRKRDWDECVVDVTAKGTLRGGLSKTMTYTDIPAKDLLKNVKL